MGRTPRVNDIVTRAATDAGLRKRIADAAKVMEQTGDRRELLRVVSEDQWTRAPAAAPRAPEPSGRPDISFEQRLSTDPNVARAIEEAGDAVPFEVRQRAKQGDVDAVGDVYAAGGKSRKPRPPSPSDRQMPLPMGEQSTGMIPYGVRGPGVPVNRNALTPDNILARLQGPQAMYQPQKAMGRPRLLGLPDKRLSTDVDLEGIRGPGPRVWQPQPTDPTPRLDAQPQLRIEGPVDDTAAQLDRIASDYASRRRPAPSYSRAAAAAAAAAAGAGIGKVAYDAFNRGPDIMAEEDVQSLDDTGGTADLAAETAPPPEVPDPAPEPAPEPVDYSMEARRLIDQLNAMRRAAGGEVPEAQEMQAEINRLLALANQTRRATFVAAPGDDASRYYQQAQGIIDQLNAAYREGSLTPNSPRAREMMAQVRQLQQAGDNLRNRRAG